MFSYHLSCFRSWFGVKLLQGYDHIPLSDVDDVACRRTCCGCSLLMKIILSWELSLIVLVLFSPIWVSHARKNKIYSNDKNEICLSSGCQGYGLDCLLPSIIKEELWILGNDKIAFDVSYWQSCAVLFFQIPTKGYMQYKGA